MSELELLRTAYGLSPVTVRPMEFGAINQNFLVETKKQRFVLKAFAPQLFQAEAIRQSCAVQERVQAAGVPTPRLLRNTAGQLLTETESGCYLLSTFVMGQHHQRMQIPPRAAFAMGQALGRLHAVLSRIEGDTPYAFPEPAAALQRLERLLQAAASRRSESAVDERAYQTLRGQMARLERLRDVAGQLSTLTSQWLHGDYQETNVLFAEDDRVVAVLDFDNLRCRPRGHEVMRAIKLCFYNGEVLLPTAYDFFAGYVHELDVPVEEVALYAPMLTYYGLTRDWPISVRYENPQAYDPRWDTFIWPDTGWWEDHLDEVTENFLRILNR